MLTLFLIPCVRNKGMSMEFSVFAYSKMKWWYVGDSMELNRDYESAAIYKWRKKMKESICFVHLHSWNLFSCDKDGAGGR